MDDHREEEDPVLIFSDVLEKIVLRAQSWPDAVDVLRKNIKAVADAEKAYGKSMKKLASASPPVYFSLPKMSQATQSKKGEVDTLLVATNLCFMTCPQQLGVHHEATSTALMAVYSGKAAQLEKIAKKNRGFIEGVAQGLWEGVVKAREGLAKAQKQKDALLEEGRGGGGKGKQDRWLAEVQLSKWRMDEREASTLYCSQVLKLSDDAHKAELECVAVLQDVLGAFMQAQCANVSKLDLDLEAIARGLKLLDGEADWLKFQGLKSIEMVKSGAVSTDWKEWDVAASKQALREGLRGDVMAGEGVEGVERSGWLHRQGTVLSFNWHKQWFVLTKEGHLYYFDSKDALTPEESFELKEHHVDLKMDKDILSLTLTAKASSWFGSTASKKFNLSGEDLLEWMSALSKYC